MHADRERPVHLLGLRHVGDPVALLSHGQRFPSDPYATLRGSKESHDGLEQRGFSAAVDADQGADRSGPEMKAGVPDGDVAIGIGHRDVVLMGRYGHMNFMRIACAQDRRVVEESLRRVEMWDFRDRQIGELSGGQKKRVFLARALAQQGRMMLLDEPFTGVDVKTEAAIVDLLRDLRSEGHVMLVSTHNLGSVPEFCDHAVLINRTVLAAGPIAETFTEANLARAFGGVLRHFRFDRSTVQAHDGRAITVLTDDERPLVFGKDGHLEFTERSQHEDVVRARATPEDER